MFISRAALAKLRWSATARKQLSWKVFMAVTPFLRSYHSGGGDTRRPGYFNNIILLDNIKIK
jgi:hypothetical protein